MRLWIDGPELCVFFYEHSSRFQDAKAKMLTLSDREPLSVC